MEGGSRRLELAWGIAEVVSDEEIEGDWLYVWLGDELALNSLVCAVSTPKTKRNIGQHLGSHRGFAHYFFFLEGIGIC
jgi:hypothetical protein